jgi:hypothetical protein
MKVPAVKEEVNAPHAARMYAAEDELRAKASMSNRSCASAAFTVATDSLTNRATPEMRPCFFVQLNIDRFNCEGLP